MQHCGKILHVFFVTRVGLDDFVWLYYIAKKIFFVHIGLQLDISSLNKEYKKTVSILRIQL